MTHMAVNHLVESFFGGQVLCDRGNRGCHHIAHFCVFRIELLEYNPQHDIALSKNAAEFSTLALLDNSDRPNPFSCHYPDRLKDRLPRLNLSGRYVSNL